jgi:hypothetical protein
MRWLLKIKGKLYLARSALLRAGLRREEWVFYSLFPPLIPQRVVRALGNVAGYYQTSRQGRD